PRVQYARYRIKSVIFVPGLTPLPGLRLVLLVNHGEHRPGLLAPSPFSVGGGPQQALGRVLRSEPGPPFPMLAFGGNALFFEQDPAQRNLRACIVRTRGDGFLERLFGLLELRLAGARAVVDQCIAKKAEQLIILESFENSGARSLRSLREVAEHETFLSG